MGLIENLKTKYNTKVQYLWCNNMGENLTFKMACEQEELGIKFEYATLGMPQQNGWVEQKFATLFNLIWAMLNSGNFKAILENGLWIEAANTTTFLENNLVTRNRNITYFNKYLGREREAFLLWYKNLVKWYCYLHGQLPSDKIMLHYWDYDHYLGPKMSFSREISAFPFGILCYSPGLN